MSEDVKQPVAADAGAPGDAGTTPTTVVSSADTTKTEAQPSWPDQWRSLMSGGDEKTLKRLERFTDPSAVFKSYTQLEAKMNGGNLTAKLPEKPTPEELTAWRKDNGIPLTPEDYKIELKGGNVLGEADQPIVKTFREAAHAHNLAPTAVNGVLDWYYKTVDDMNAQQAAEDAAYREASEDALRGTWGNEFRRNVQIIENMMAGWPEGLRDAIVNARTPDGRLLGANPHYLQAMASMALELNPVETVVPGGNPAAMASRKEEIERTMREDYKKYDADKAMQAEYEKIINAEIALKKRHAA